MWPTCKYEYSSEQSNLKPKSKYLLYHSTTFSCFIQYNPELALKLIPWFGLVWFPFTQELLECDKCRNSFHPECLGPNHPTRPTKKRIWVLHTHLFISLAVYSNILLDCSYLLTLTSVTDLYQVRSL